MWNKLTSADEKDVTLTTFDDSTNLHYDNPLPMTKILTKQRQSSDKANQRLKKSKTTTSLTMEKKILE